MAGAALAVGAAATVAAQTVQPSTACDLDRPLLQVVASPDIAPAVDRIARDVQDAAGCNQVEVRAETGSDALAALRQSSVPSPDVWIPDSSLWVRRGADERLVAPVGQESVASSPLVLAVPGAAVTWEDAVAALTAGNAVVHLPAEVSSPSTVGLLAALTSTVQPHPDGRALLARLLRAARVDAGLPDGAGALSALDTAADGAVPVPEQAVFHRRGTPGARDVTAVYPTVAGTPFDYPFTTLRATGPHEATARRLLAELRSPAGQQVLRAAGFRGTDGTGDGLTADRGVDGTQPGTVAVPDGATVGALLHTFDAVRREARLLAVVDVSGSMAAPVPGADGSTRLDLALRAAAAGMELYPETTEVGLWSFSEDVPGGGDHQELVPIGPLTDAGPSGRKALALAMAGVRPVPDGGTGLYDTTLAAVRTVRAGWDPERVNAVVVLTDGEDTDHDGIGLDELLAMLRSEQASGPAVPVITIAYGDDSGAEALAAISAATGGATYRTSDPGQILQVFLDAVGQRACRPQCETPAGS
jgi:Ca-activated chloride channel family protein